MLSIPPVPLPTFVPGRSTILGSSVVFVLASLFLLIEFICIFRKADAMVINVFGALESVGWILGFALLLDWQVSFLFPAVGVSRRALAGCAGRYENKVVIVTGGARGIGESATRARARARAGRG